MKQDRFHVYRVTDKTEHFRRWKTHRIWNALKIGNETFGVFDDEASKEYIEFFRLEKIGIAKTLDESLLVINRSKKTLRVRNKNTKFLFLRMSFLATITKRSEAEERELTTLRKIFDVEIREKVNTGKGE